MKYSVRLERVEYAHFDINAKSEEEAIDKANIKLDRMTEKQYEDMLDCSDMDDWVAISADKSEASK